MVPSHLEPQCVEQTIKQQFARLLVAEDWQLFKKMAEFYLQGAASLRIADLNVPDCIKLVARNSQKRLHIGVGTELLLKAIYLKREYQVNKLADNQINAPTFPYTFRQVERFKLRNDKTFGLGELIDNLPKLLLAKDMAVTMRGLRIAKVFRNKEGHAVFRRHDFDRSNYRDIEASLMSLYVEAFMERLEVRFSVEPK